MEATKTTDEISKQSSAKARSAIDYFNKNQDHYVDMLRRLVKVPSISLPGFDYRSVAECGQLVHQYLLELGMDHVETIYIEQNNRPYIYAESLKAPGKPTLLFYAHYDVQPVGTQGKWESDPFELTEKNGRLFARGSADDKGGLVAELAAIDAWMKTAEALPVNVKILFEGEEEDGSSCLNQFIERYREKIQADAIVIVDAENFDTETAGLTISLRGMVAASVEVKTLKQPVHSGLWGGPLPDAAMALTKALSSLIDDKGEINIPEILAMVKPLAEKDQNRLRSLPFDEKKFRKEAGLLDGVPLIGQPSEARERIWFKPKIAINAMQAGSRAQAGNIIVESAWAKVGIRILSTMDAEKTFEALKRHLEKQKPFGLTLEVKKLGGGQGWQTETDHPLFEKMQQSLAEGWGREPVKMGCGASIPFVKTFSEALGGAPALLLGVADPLTLAHSENESVSKEGLANTVRSLITFMEKVSSN